MTRVRSILFVPGDSRRKLEKAVSVPADAHILDWEDAVAESGKAAARTITLEAMRAHYASRSGVLIRINSYRAELAEGDCAAVRESRPGGVVLPKCEDAEEVRAILRLLPDSTVVVPLIESPKGVQNAPGIAACSERVVALMFGAEDYSAEAGIMRSEGEPELTFARGAVVNAARACGTEVFDSPLMQFRDRQAVRRSAWESRRFGFTGRAAIHPSQVPIINEVFTPSEDEIDRARAVLARFEDHGGGVYAVDGALEDLPIIREARRVLDRAR